MNFSQLIEPCIFLARKNKINIFDCPLFVFNEKIDATEIELNGLGKCNIMHELLDRAFDYSKNYPIPFNPVRLFYDSVCTHLDVKSQKKTKVIGKSFLYINKYTPDNFWQSDKYYNSSKDLHGFYCIGGTSFPENKKLLSHAMCFSVLPEETIMGNDGRLAYLWQECRVLQEINRKNFVFEDVNSILLKGNDTYYNINDPNRQMCALMSSLFVSAIYLLGGVSEKNNHIVEVTPNKNAKEVRWLEGRKHFVVLSPEKAAKEHSMPKVEMTLKSCDSITRIAHNRRAHTRTFKSERFKNKRGVTIFIKEAWIGPKKWKDKSQSIYRVISDNKEVFT